MLLETPAAKPDQSRPDQSRPDQSEPGKHKAGKHRGPAAAHSDWGTLVCFGRHCRGLDDKTVRHRGGKTEFAHHNRRFGR